MVRILQVHTPHRSYGGEDRVVSLEAEVLREAGHELRQLLAPNPDSRARAAALFAVSSVNPAASRRVVSAARAFRAQVVHVHNTWFAQSPGVVRALRQNGFPVVVTMHNYRAFCIAANAFRDGTSCLRCAGHSPWAGIRHKCYETRPRSVVAAGNVALHRHLRTWTSDVDVTIALSENARKIYIGDGFEPDRLHVKYNFTPDPGPRPARPSASRVYLYVGRLVGEKGIRFLLEAWRAAALPDARLLVAGTGPLLPKLSAQAVPGVTFLGHEPPERVTQLMLGARALLFPSLWAEPFGMGTVEAMAAGLPVAGTAVGAVPELLPEESLLVQPGDVGAMSGVLHRLQSDELADRLGAASRARYLEAFTPAGNLKQLIALYESAIAQGRGRPR